MLVPIPVRRLLPHRWIEETLPIKTPLLSAVQNSDSFQIQRGIRPLLGILDEPHQPPKVTLFEVEDIHEGNPYHPTRSHGVFSHLLH